MSLLQKFHFCSFLLLFFTVCTLYAFFFYLSPSRDISSVSTGAISAQKKQVQNPETACKIPRISPWHESISKFIAHPRQVTCEKMQPDFTYVDEIGLLIFERTAVVEYEQENHAQIDCRYAYFDRGKIDQELIFENWQILTKNVPLENRFLQVECKDLQNSSLVYMNVHAFPIRKIDTDRSNRSVSDQENPNVFLFFVESLSMAMARRHLPSTFQYLKTKMQAHIFENFQKVGENTLPNLAALFTGKRLRNEQPGMKSELKLPGKDGFYDHWPMVWSTFKERGYTTTYLEDYARLSTFHYGDRRGFQKTPVDFWYFPFWEAVRRVLLRRKNARFCFGNRPILDIFNEILSRHISAGPWNTEKQFLFSTLIDLSHDYSSDIERADDVWKKFFQNLFEKDHLKNTILIFAGDHGPRFVDIRSTVAGFVEERTPFLAIFIPELLREKFPDMDTVLQANTKKLVTLFDLHATLLDVVEGQFSGSTTDNGTAGRCTSLFRPLPDNRTCTEAGIPDRYCLCRGFKNETVSSQLALRGARLVLHAVRNMTSAHRSQCVRFKLNEVLYLIRFPSTGENGTHVPYTVAFTTHPLNASFEGVVWRDKDNGALAFQTGSLERINSFGAQGQCVKDIESKKYCLCKSFMRTRKTS